MARTDQFDGDRRGTLTDPFGHVWLLATRKETISFETMRQRFESIFAAGAELDAHQPSSSGPKGSLNSFAER